MISVYRVWTLIRQEKDLYFYCDISCKAGTIDVEIIPLTSGNSKLHLDLLVIEEELMDEFSKECYEERQDKKHGITH